MTTAAIPGATQRRRRYRLRRIATEAAAAGLGLVLLVWVLVPVWNMLLIALDPDEGETEFTAVLWPDEPSLNSFRAVATQDYWYLEHFWQQFANSFMVGLATMALTVAVASLASFAVGRMRLTRVRVLTNTALLVYAVPAALLAIPFVRLAQRYGLADSLWSVIAAEVMFALPFAVLVLQQYATIIPLELDEAARIDGASPLQVYRHIYLPLMAPALAAVGTYALLLAWGEYLYQYLLLSSTGKWTVAVAIEQFFDADEAPWNYMMALAIVYALPPIAIFYALRRYMTAGLTMGGVKG
ncbi:MAG TPA: carbohydrate ABC transporter permease [Stellaceae bacterium]|nr:carbohydrate ABC transporter permease [Stellaceae bacterium]